MRVRLAYEARDRGMCGMTIDVAAPTPFAAGQECGARRLLVVFNPAAGRKRRPRYEAVLAALRGEGCVVTTVETEAPGHAERIARDVQPGTFDVIVAAGGDGTMAWSAAPSLRSPARACVRRPGVRSCPA